MSAPAPALGFRVIAVEDYAAAQPALRAVREAVFVREQNVPLALELDAERDPRCQHVLAFDASGEPIGTGRLTPDRRIGRMAVLASWRGRGVGEALLAALLERAQALGWREVSLHSQAGATGFYARHGFLPFGERFLEAGIEHVAMYRLLGAANPVDGREAALAPLIGLAQRLPTAFEFRAIEENVDRNDPAAYLVNDRDGWYYRPLGHRFDGETRIDGGPRARQLRARFEPVWERARPCTELRALGI